MAKRTTKKTTTKKKKKKTSGVPRTKPGAAARTRRKKTRAAPRVSGSARGSDDAPALFRLNLEVGDLPRADAFYSKLLGTTGRRQAGSRVYFTCGAVTLQVVDVSGSGAPHPAAKALYFVVRDLEKVFARARGLACLSRERVHGEPGGAITVRPWGERSFYAEDPWNNPLCFVESGTIYGG